MTKEKHNQLKVTYCKVRKPRITHAIRTGIKVKFHIVKLNNVNNTKHLPNGCKLILRKVQCPRNMQEEISTVVKNKNYHT